MFPSGWSAQPAALQQSQAAQTPTGQWGQSVASTTAVGLLDPLTGSSGAAVAVAPFAGSNGGVASWMVPTAPAAPPPVDPWANVAVPSLEDKAAIAREKNRIAQRRWVGTPEVEGGSPAALLPAGLHDWAALPDPPASAWHLLQVPREGAATAGGGAAGRGQPGS